MLVKSTVSASLSLPTTEILSTGANHPCSYVRVPAKIVSEKLFLPLRHGDVVTPFTNFSMSIVKPN